VVTMLWRFHVTVMREAATPIQLVMALTNGCTNTHLKDA